MKNVTDTVEKWMAKHGEEWFAFCGTVLLGCIIHLYMFTNKFYNYFEMNNILTEMSYDKGDTLAMGRWFLPVVSRMSSVFSMPVINGMICLICLGIVSALLVRGFEICGKISMLLVSGLVVSFPGVASYLSYGVNTDVFSVALLLSVLAGYLMCKGMGRQEMRIRLLYLGVGALSLMFCIGTYQPFMSVTIAIIFGRLLLDVCKNGEGIIPFLKKFGLYLAALAVGFILYFFVLKVFNAVMQIEVGNYHGINEMTSFSLKGIAKGFVYTYLYFGQYLFTLENANTYLMVLVNGVLVITFAYGVFVKNHGKDLADEAGCVQKVDTKGNLLCRITLFVLAPIGVNASPFLMADRVGNGVDRYMMFSMSILYVLLIALLQDRRCGSIVSVERTVKNASAGGGSDRDTAYGKFETITGAVAALGLAVVIFGNAMLVNQGYFRAEAMTKSEDHLLNRLVMRIEENDNYQEGMPVYFVGAQALFPEELYIEHDAFKSMAIVDGTQVKPWYNYDALVKYMEVYMSFPIVKPEDSVRKNFDALVVEEGSALWEMPIYPREGSMKEIDGVLVVKLSQPEAEEDE